jgi:hypothetical protein
MTNDRTMTSDTDPTKTVAGVFVEAVESPVAGGRWEILDDDTVRYI